MLVIALKRFTLLALLEHTHTRGLGDLRLKVP